MGTNKTITFDVISSDDIHIKEIVETYNSTYKTDFRIVRFIYSEVVFAKIQVSQYETADIFELGRQFGTYIQHKRQKGEIDW